MPVKMVFGLLPHPPEALRGGFFFLAEPAEHNQEYARSGFDDDCEYRPLDAEA